MSEPDSDTFPPLSQLSPVAPLAAFPSTTDPVAGQRPLINAPLPRTTQELGCHSAAPSALRKPDDEFPIDWTTLVRPAAPSDPFESLPLVPPILAPASPHAIYEDGAGNCHAAGDPGERDPFAVLITRPKSQERQHCWDEYVAAAMHVNTIQLQTAPDLRRFQRAANDDQLRALGFVLPSHFHGDLDQLALAQQVPQRGGFRVSSLFEGNQVALSEEDQQAMSTIRATGGADDGFLDAIHADYQLQGSLQRVQAASQEIVAANESVRGAQAKIRRTKASEMIVDGHDRLDKLQRQSDMLASVLEFVDGGPARVAKVISEGIDKLSHVGSLSALVVRLLSGHALDAAQRRITEAKEDERRAHETELDATLAAAQAKALAAVILLGAAKSDLAAAMASRRMAYDKAGRAATRASGGSTKVAAIMSTIPIAEELVGIIEIVHKATAGARPTCTARGAFGYGLAVAHHPELADALPRVIGWLEYVHDRFGGMAGDWRERLNELRAAREQMAGSRPEGDA